MSLVLTDEQRYETLRALESEIKRTEQVLAGPMRLDAALRARAADSVRVMREVVAVLTVEVRT